MRPPLLTALWLLALSAPAFAALPPVYQRQAELRAIIDSREVVEQLDGQMIDAVLFIATDRYEVRAGGCTLLVRIVSRQVDDAIAGPRLFDVEVGEKQC